MICIIKQDGSGNDVNEIQIYDGSSWRNILPPQPGNEGKYLKTNGIIANKIVKYKKGIFVINDIILLDAYNCNTNAPKEVIIKVNIYNF